MNKKEIIEFFDRCAPFWDEHMVRNESIISLILDNAGVNKGITVLDVATGTGVLIPDYLKRSVKSVTAIDFSPKMIEIAKKNHTDAKVNFILDDVQKYATDERFDCIMVYNAFPHFQNSKKIISHLAGLLNKGGTLSIAHGMSREALAKHHSGTASRVSIPLPTIDELEQIMSAHLEVTVKISNNEMYQLCGVKK